MFVRHEGYYINHPYYYTGMVQHHGDSNGILNDVSELDGGSFCSDDLDQNVVDFYENTSNYKLNAWSEWCSFFKPFGWLLSKLFSQRLQQLNVPLTGLDTSLGMTNDVKRWNNDSESLVVWLRKLNRTGHVLYSGSYSTCSLPNIKEKCVKVVFPLPNGNAIVIMKPTVIDGHKLELASVGSVFGDPGFYFTVHTRKGTYAKYLRSFKEKIIVYSETSSEARADHSLSLWGVEF